MGLDMRLALFDFDGTLTTRDSLMPFLRHVVGTPAFIAGLGAMSPVLAAYAFGWMRNDRAKERVLHWFLGGRCLGEVEDAGQAFAQTRLPRLLRPSMMAALHQHQAKGDTCVLVSASLGCYLRPWAQAHRFDAVLCSELVATPERSGEPQRINGQLAGANCFGPEKVARVQAWLAGRTPTHISAYGDSRGDREMLALADSPHYRPWRHA